MKTKDILIILRASSAKIMVLFLVCVLVRGLTCAWAVERKMPNIVIITFAGLRNSESIDEPAHQYIPHIWNQMLKEGTFYND